MNWFFFLYTGSPRLVSTEYRSRRIKSQELQIIVYCYCWSTMKIYILKTSKSVRWFWNSVLIRIQTNINKAQKARILDRRTKYVPKRYRKTPSLTIKIFPNSIQISSKLSVKIQKHKPA